MSILNFTGDEYVSRGTTLCTAAPRTYDPNGNITSIYPSHSYAWDALGHPVTVDTVNATYDAQGRMVEQQRGSAYTQIIYGPDGSKLALMNGQSLVKAFVLLPGGATAVYNSSGLAYYRHSDWLGSSRLTSSPSRTVLYDRAYAPFGESYAETGTTDHSFTGQNEDTVQGLDDFLFREYSASQQGRWISPDPAGLAAVNLADPQSWNRYAYVGNNPLAMVDPAGLCGDAIGSGPCSETWAWLGGGGSGGGGGWSGWAGQGSDIAGPPNCDPGSRQLVFPGGFGPSGVLCNPDAGGANKLGAGAKGGGNAWRQIKAGVKTLGCAAAVPLIGTANLAGGTAGAGIGGSAGVGFILGASITGGAQVVATKHGQVGIAITLGGNPGYFVFGAGYVGGVQGVASNAETLKDFAGPAVGFNGSSGPVGVDYTSSGDNNTNLTLTVGDGAGTKGAGAEVTNTWVPFQMNCGPNQGPG